MVEQDAEDCSQWIEKEAQQLDDITLIESYLV